MNEIDQTLQARGSVYGPFVKNAVVSQKLKYVLEALTTAPLEEDQAEALAMICFKISRIVTGDPNYRDNWVDIAGYAMLVADRLAKGEE